MQQQKVIQGVEYAGFEMGAMVAALLAASLRRHWRETTVLTNVTVIDGTGAAAKPDSAIVMTDGKIAYVGPVSGLKAPSGRQGRRTCPASS